MKLQYESSKKGFTLLELLVILLLFGLALSLVGPKIGRFIPESPKDFPSKVKTLLEKARLQAFQQEKYFLFVIDPEERKIFLAGEDLKPLANGISIPEEIEIKGEGLLKIENFRAILFGPGGFSSGGEIEIVLPEGKNVVFRIAKVQAYIGLETEY